MTKQSRNEESGQSRRILLEVGNHNLSVAVIWFNTKKVNTNQILVLWGQKYRPLDVNFVLSMKVEIYGVKLFDLEYS